jgi:hypothetical protein
MLTGISGGRGDGTQWPPVGGVLEVGDEEGRDLCAAHLAVPVVEERAETAEPAAADVETRAAAAKRAPRKG